MNPREPKRAQGHDEPRRWLTAKQAALYLGLPSEKAVYQRVRRGQLPAHPFGKRSLRFLAAELDAVLSPRRGPSAT